MFLGRVIIGHYIICTTSKPHDVGFGGGYNSCDVDFHAVVTKEGAFADIVCAALLELPWSICLAGSISLFGNSESLLVGLDRKCRALSLESVSQETI